MALLIAVTIVRVSKLFFFFQISLYDYLFLVVLPYADLILFTATSSLSIIYGVFLAIVILGEKFVYKYDMPAIALILAGCILTVMQCNFSQTMVDGEEVVKLLTRTVAIVFLVGSCGIFIISYICVQW